MGNMKRKFQRKECQNQILNKLRGDQNIKQLNSHDKVKLVKWQRITENEIMQEDKKKQQVSSGYQTCIHVQKLDKTYDRKMMRLCQSSCHTYIFKRSPRLVKEQINKELYKFCLFKYMPLNSLSILRVRIYLTEFIKQR